MHEYRIIIGANLDPDELFCEWPAKFDKLSEV